MRESTCCTIPRFHSARLFSAAHALLLEQTAGIDLCRNVAFYFRSVPCRTFCRIRHSANSRTLVCGSDHIRCLGHLKGAAFLCPEKGVFTLSKGILLKRFIFQLKRFSSTAKMYSLRSRTTLNAGEESIVKLKFMERFSKVRFGGHI